MSRPGGTWVASGLGMPGAVRCSQPPVGTATRGASALPGPFKRFGGQNAFWRKEGGRGHRSPAKDPGRCPRGESGRRSRAGTGRHSHPSPGHVRTGRGPPNVEAAWGGRAVHHWAWGVASLAGRGAGLGGLGTTRPPRSQPDPRGRQEVGPSRCGGKRPRCSERQRFSEDAGGPGGSVSAAGFGLHAGRGQQRGQEEGPGRGSRTGHRGEAQAAQPGEGPGARSARGENGEKVP